MPAKKVDGILVRCARVKSFRSLAGTIAQDSLSDGLSLNAGFNRPSGIAVDTAGSVCVADVANSAIR